MLKNKGFTLIEVIVSITLCMVIVLIVSYSLKFFIGNYKKNKDFFLLNQKYLFLLNMLNIQYNNIVPFKFQGKYFIKGSNNYLVFLTSNSDTVYPGINEVGYFFNENKNILQICFTSVSKKDDIVDYEVLKQEGKCTEIDNIKDVVFKYLVGDEYKDDVDGVFPLKINFSFKLANLNRKINIYTGF